MKFSKFLFLLLFPIVAEVVVACCHCNTVTQTEYYTYDNITASLLDNSGKEPLLTSNPDINKKAFGIRIKANRIITAKASPTQTLFIASANAFKCECPPPYLIKPRDSIINIKVITLNNFDDSHPASSDISEYFKVYEQHQFYSIDPYLRNRENLLYDKEELSLKFDLLLITPPTQNKTHGFKIIISLSSNKKLESETTPVNLL